MLSREIADLVEYLIIVDGCGWNARSSLVLYRGHFRGVVVVDAPIRMMVVMVVMMMRTGGCCGAGRTYWSANLSVLAVMMMARMVSWFL